MASRHLTYAWPPTNGRWARPTYTYVLPARLALALAFKQKVPELTITYEDAAEVILDNLSKGGRFSHRRVGGSAFLLDCASTRMMCHASKPREDSILRGASLDSARKIRQLANLEFVFGPRMEPSVCQYARSASPASV